MKKHLCCLTFAVFIFIAASPLFLFAESYTLDDLYAIALKRSEKIMLSEENLRIAGTGMDKARAALIPKVSTYGSFTKYSEDKRSDSGSLMQTDRAATWGLRLDESLSLGGRELTALGVAGDTVEKSRYELSSVKEEFMLGLAAAFYDVLKSRKAVDIAGANWERLKKYRAAAGVRLKAGEITKTALLRAESELSGAEAERVRALNALEAARVVLARIAGVDGDFDVREGQDKKDFVLPALAELQKMAGERRAEIKALKTQKVIAQKQVNYARGALWPNVSLAAVYARADQNPPPSSLNRDSIYGSVSLNFPFYEGGLRKAEIMEAEARQRQADLSLRDGVKGLAVDVEKAYLDYATLQGTLKFQQDQLAYAQDNFNAVTRQFDLGLANGIDVIDANNALLAAQRQLADTSYNSHYAMLKLKRAVGILLDDGEDTKNRQ